MDYSVSISVIMATYNTELMVLKEAVDSILDQSFKDFEFIIIDDGSDNGTEEYLSNIKDSRVSIIKNPSNVGITKSLNIGLRNAKGKYIARMDADDISLPDRFEKEFRYMEKHPDVIVCGSGMDTIDDRGKKTGFKYIPRYKNMEDYRAKLLFKNPGPVHPTAMIRHETLKANDIMYDERLIYAQDYGLWGRLSHYGKIHILNTVLLYRRKHEKQISIEKRDIQIRCDQMTQKKVLSDLLGNVSDEEVSFHYMYSSGRYPKTAITPEIVAWYERLLRENLSKHIYNQKYLYRNIINAKKILVAQSLKPGMSLSDQAKMIFRYLPFFSGLRLIGGCLKMKLRGK